MRATQALLLAVAAVFAAVVVAQPPPPDHCAPFMTCQTCVAQPLCGWCSEPVIYANNQTGPQCAGYNQNGSDPFACNGIYSTEQCVAGYVCDESDFTCKLGQPGQGTTLDKCEANCTNNGQVYLCNETTHTCYQVPRGTNGSSSYSVCMAECTHPSSHPSSPNPAPTPPPLYSCNYTSGECEHAAPGQGSSLQVCEQQCFKSNQSYICNKFLSQCVKLPPSVHGESLKECEAECNPQPNPGPPPQMEGLWRGVEINNGYIQGEYDLFVNATTVIFIGHQSAGSIVTIVGKPFNLPHSDNLALWIMVTSGPGTGEYIKTISDQSGQPGPETKFMTTAMGAAGAPAPSSITDAMTAKDQTVFAFAQCQTPNCVFTLRDGSGFFYRSATSNKKMTSKMNPSRPQIEDHCSQYGDSCTDCISHQYCGWCSVNVTYKDGTQGTQCAGFNGVNGSSPFVCAGRYSTLACDTGYTCNSEYQCVPTAPGNGMSKRTCEALCHPTPPPTPPEQQYVCNVTLKQCFKCNETHCPGSMPLGQCESACTNPKPGPHGNLVGTWRGVRIQNDYKVGEVEFVFTKTNVSFYSDGTYEYCANVTSLGADLMLLDILDGPYKGWSFGAIYQESTESNGMYDYITWAKGILGQAAPQSYDEAMYTEGMEEYVMAKCMNTPCVFNPPS